MIFGLLIFSFLACNQEMEKPKDLIPRAKMISILKDIYLFKQVKNYRLEPNLPDTPHANLAILRDHNVSLEQFQRSYQYYIIDDAAYDEILEEIKEEIYSELPPGEIDNDKEGVKLPPSAQ